MLPVELQEEKKTKKKTNIYTTKNQPNLRMSKRRLACPRTIG